LISALNALHHFDQDCVVACHLKNYCFVITYLLEDEQELSLGMLDTSKTYIIFDALCLFIHHLLCVLFTLCGVFMHFPELTYLQDATVPVPVFNYFCVLEKLHRKYSQNWTKKAEVPNYLTQRRSPKESRRWTKGQPHLVVVRATPWPRHQVV
jgi:hypothetical protein